MVSSTSVYILAVVAAVLMFGCECQNSGDILFPDDLDGAAQNTQFRPRPPRPPPQQPADTPTLTASVTSSTERPAANPEVPVVFRPSCSGCPFTPQYNPVCGSDGQTYGNVNILNCERSCGKDVRMVLQGGCSANRG